MNPLSGDFVNFKDRQCGCGSSQKNVPNILRQWY